jgi:hypothetical protein
LFVGGTGQPSDPWVMRLDSSGNIVWQKSFTGTNGGDGYSVKEATDGGFIVVGKNGNSSSDAIALKLDSAGSIQWQKSYGGPGFDYAFSVLQLATGEYMIAGITDSFGAGSSDAWILKLDAIGNVLLQKTYGTANQESGYSVDTVSDGGYLIAGNSNGDLWQIKLDANAVISPDCPLANDTFATVSQTSLNQAVPAVSAVNIAATVADTSLLITNTAVPASEQCSVATCVFCDDFEDGILAPDWDYPKPSWSESGGNLVAAAAKKAMAIASPAFGGCTNCSFEAGVLTAGGAGNKVSVLAWYADKGNNVEVLIKEESNKIIFKQRANGSIASKTKALVNIDPNVPYNIRITFDGSVFTLLVDGNSVATLPAAGSPNGTIGFVAKKTTARFGHVLVE